MGREEGGSRDPGDGQGLSALCRPGEAAEIPPAHRWGARYPSGLREHQEHHHHGPDSTLRGPLRRISRKSDPGKGVNEVATSL